MSSHSSLFSLSIRVSSVQLFCRKSPGSAPTERSIKNMHCEFRQHTRLIKEIVCQLYSCRRAADVQNAHYSEQLPVHTCWFCYGSYLLFKIWTPLFTKYNFTPAPYALRALSCIKANVVQPVNKAEWICSGRMNMQKQILHHNWKNAGWRW